ncbi:MAG: M56 family metallopeptidase [Gammaproteobacteria bacterium]|nr:M56 family metallopeptidase [Gammaproteobacteria bacterium]
MNGAGLFVNSVVNALGWTLLHFVWQGVIIAVVYAFLSVTLKASKANIRYNLGVVALFLMLLVPVLTFLSVFQAPFPQTGSSDPLGSISVLATGMVSAYGVATPWFGELGLWFDVLAPWAVAGWLAGVTVMSRKLYREWRQVRQLVRDKVRPLPARWQQVADSLHQLFGIRVIVRVLESGMTSVPMVLGWLKPVVLIPSSALLGLSSQQLEMLLAHEFAHIRRMDYLINLLQIFVETVLFYHPAVRWLSSQVRHERELCCDELVVELKGDSLAYARALAEMEELRSLIPSIGMAASGGQLLTRINRLSAVPLPQKGVLHWMVGFLVMAAGLGMFTMTHYALTTASEPDVPVAVAAPVAMSPVSAPAPALTEPAASNAGFSGPVAATETVGPQVVESEVPAVPDEIVPTVSAATRVAPVRAGGMDLPAVPKASQEEPPAQTEIVPAAASAGTPEAAAPIDLPPAPELAVPSAAEQAPIDLQQVSGGRLLSGKQPKFPRKARLRGTEGWVRVAYTVDRNGRVHDIYDLESLNGRIFSKAVHKAIATWRFEPFMQDGELVEQSVVRTIQFSIDPNAEIVSGCVFATGTRLCRDRRHTDTREHRLYQAKASNAGKSIH